MDEAVVTGIGEAVVAALAYALPAGLLLGAGPVAAAAGRWTVIDRWWRGWCAVACGVWAAALHIALSVPGYVSEPIDGIADVAAASGLVGAAPAPIVAAGATLLAVIDLREHRLPHPLTAAAGSWCIAAGILIGAADAAAWSALIAYSAHIGIRAFAPRAIGGGDAQLAVSVGALAGPAGPTAVAGAFVLAAAGTVALAHSVGGRGVRGPAVPHGPSLCVAAMVASSFR